MGRATRNGSTQNMNSPGPGTYQHDTKFRGPKYHFGGRHSSSVSSLIPGPGQYTPDFTQRQSCTSFKISFGGKPSTGGTRNGPPGPGTYEVKVVKSRCGGRFGQGQRHSLSMTQNIPGPGTYNKSALNSNIFASPRYSFGLKPQGSKVLNGKEVPGPGTYNLAYLIGKAGVKSTMLPRRPDTAPSYGRNVPGPGTYTPNGIFKISAVKYNTIRLIMKLELELRKEAN